MGSLLDTFTSSLQKLDRAGEYVEDLFGELGSKVSGFFDSYLIVFEGVNWNNLNSRNTILLIITVMGFVFFSHVFITAVSVAGMHAFVPPRLKQNAFPVMSGHSMANFLMNGILLIMLLRLLYNKDRVVLPVMCILAISLVSLLSPNRTITQGINSIILGASANFLFCLSLLFLQHTLVGTDTERFSVIIKISIIMSMLDMTISLATSWLALCRIALARISCLVGVMLSGVTVISLFSGSSEHDMQSLMELMYRTSRIYSLKTGVEKIMLVVVIGCVALSFASKLILLCANIQRTLSICFKKTLIRLYQLSLVSQEAERALQDNE